MTLLFKRRKSTGDPSPRKSAGTLVLEMEGRILFESDAASLVDRTIVIGRDKSCDWSTAGVDNTVSSRHAELFRRGGGVWIRDLGSRNGLQMRGERIQEHRLVFGEPVLIGACKVTFEPPKRQKNAGGAAYHRLEQANGPESGRTFELKGDADIILGSDPSCGNGTSVNGVPIAKDKERLLRDGDVLSAAYVEFRFADKGAAHVNARIGAKLLVAAATVAVSLLGYSCWNLARREAGWFLARARASAERWTPDSRSAVFAETFALLDQASVARNADAYRSNVADMRREMEAWTNTIVGWQSVRSSLGNCKWVSAQGRFHTLSSWTWNADSATRAHLEADAVQSLVNAFLVARADLRRTNWESGREHGAFAALAKLLSDALGAVRAIPGGDKLTYLRPLVIEADELRAEFEATLAKLDAIPSALAALAWPEGSGAAPDAARASIAALSRMKEEDAAHAEARAKEITSTNFPYRGNAAYPYHAPILAIRIAEAQEPLRGLAEAEETLEANAASIAAGQWDALRNPLPLPPRELTDRYPEFMRYSRLLEERNERLCGKPGSIGGVCGGFLSRIGNLEKKGFGPFLSSEPAAFASLRDPDHLAAALAFVEPRTPLPQPEAAEPVCAYDRLVGVFELGDFIVELAAETSPLDAASTYADAWRGRAWRSELQEVREGLELLRSFRHWRDTDRTGLVRLVLDARPPSGSNKCAAALAAADKTVSAVTDWCEEDFAEACEADGSDRALLLRDAVMLLLASQGDLRKEAARKRADAIVSRWRSLQGKLRGINGRAETDPTGAWREIVAHGLPVNAAPFKGAWRNLSKLEGRQ